MIFVEGQTIGSELILLASCLFVFVWSIILTLVVGFTHLPNQHDQTTHAQFQNFSGIFSWQLIR